MEKFFYQVQEFFKKAKTAAQEHLWTDLKNPQIPDYVENRLADYPVEVHRHFEYNFRRKLNRIRNSRNFLLVLGVITLLNGVIIVPVGVTFYLWHLKNKKLPKLAEQNLERSVRQYNLALKRGGGQPAFQAPPAFDRSVPSRPQSPVAPQTIRKQPRRIDTQFDPTDITIDNLRDGYIFDYDLKTWEVNHHFQFDWEDGHSERAYKATSHIDTIFLYLKKEAGQLLVNVASPVNIHALHNGLEQEILSNGIPRNILEFNGNVYYREMEKKGEWFDISGGSGGVKVTTWEYLDTTRTEVLKIENYGRGQIKASLGKWVSSFHFSEILPSSHS